MQAAIQGPAGNERGFFRFWSLECDRSPWPIQRCRPRWLRVSAESMIPVNSLWALAIALSLTIFVLSFADRISMTPEDHPPMVQPCNALFAPLGRRRVLHA